MSNQRVLITGGSGFIGTNLTEHFLGQGWQVLNLDIASPRNQVHSPQWHRVDILDRSLLIKEVQAFQPDVFLHFAARTDLDEKHDLDGYAANIDGVCHVVEAIRAAPSIKRAIFASSQLVCRLGYQPLDEFDYCPTTLYGRSKVLGEKIVRAAYNMDAVWTIVRPTSIWGPWFDVPYKNFFLAISRNQYFHPGGIVTEKQWGFVGNSVYQIHKILQSEPEPIHQKTFYLADFSAIDLREFSNLIQSKLNVRPIITIPENIYRSLANLGDILHLLAWKNPPLTSFRYKNIITSELQVLEPLMDIVGELPYSLEQGCDKTLQWLMKYQ